MNFSLNAKRRIPPQLQILLRKRQNQIKQQQQHNIRECFVNRDISVSDEVCVKDVITYEIGELSTDVTELEPYSEEPAEEPAEKPVKDTITYNIGELSNDVTEPQPCMEEPVIETLSSAVDNNISNNIGTEV